MESTAVAILRKELGSVGGSAAMSSLSVRVKWGQGDLAQLGNFRTFLKKYPEVFNLEVNTVHLANFSTPETPAAEALPKAGKAGKSAAAAPAGPAAALGKAAAAVLSKGAAAPKAQGKAGAAAPAKGAASPAKVGAVPLAKGAATPAKVGAVPTAKGAVQTSKAGIPAPKSGDKRAPSGASDGPEPKVARRTPPAASAASDSKAKAFHIGSAASKAPTEAIRPPLKEVQYAPKLSGFALKEETNGKGGSGNSKAAAATTAVRAPLPAKARPWAPAPEPAAPPFAHSKGAAPVPRPPPSSEGSGTAPEAAATGGSADASFVPKGGLSKGTLMAPRKSGAQPPPSAAPSALHSVAKSGTGPGRGPIPPSQSKAAGGQALVGAAAAEPAEGAPPAPVPPRTSLAGQLAPLKEEAAAAQAPSKSAAVRALEPKGAAQAKRAAPLTVQPKRPAAPEAAWRADALEGVALARAIAGCKARGIELELAELARRVAPSEAYRAACRKYVALLQSAAAGLACRRDMATPAFEVCGASAQGTELDGADVDVALRLRPGLAAEARGACAEELRRRLQMPPQASFLSVSDGMQLYAHAAAPLSLELSGAQPRTVAHVLLVEARGQPERPPLSVDAVVRQLCDAFGPARDLARLAKLWAVNHGLSGQHEGYPSGVAWTLLVIFFLQTEKLVPPYAALGQKEVPPSRDAQLSILLRGFFEFLAARDGHANRGVSVTHAQEYRAPSGVLFLEDPAELHETGQQQNLAESVGESQWSRVVDEARRAVERLTARPQRWFHWAEVFDPREVPPEKIARLQPLAKLAAGDGAGSPAPDAPASAPAAGAAPGAGFPGRPPAAAALRHPPGLRPVVPGRL